MNTNSNEPGKDSAEKGKIYGDPAYSANEDIYSKEKKEPFTEDEFSDQRTEKSDPSLEEDLDIPGGELDDDNEAVGEEDEENNYYSLGGDNHNDLDENKED